MNIKKAITKSQAIDTGMALTLIFLILGNVILNQSFFNILSILTLIITMSVPIIFKPIAVIWFGFSQILGNIMSYFILAIIFYLFLTPYSRIVLLFKRDPMNRNAFQDGTNSVFVSRNITFSKKDLENAY